jgi:uncharacterized phage protein gp47/JayE
MAFLIPSRQDIADAFIADYAAAQPDKNVARGSDPWRLSRVISAIAWMIMARLLGYSKQALPDTATGAALLRWGEGIYQFKKKGPAVSQGAAALHVTGTPGTTVTLGLELTSSDGTLFEVAGIAQVIGGGGSVDVDIASITPGLIANKLSGTALNFTSAPTGINAAASLVADMANGADNEDEEPYRARLLAHIGDPPEGGAVHDYIEWALRIPGASSAYVWQHRRGRGSIDVAVLGAGDGLQRVIADLTPYADYIESVRPGGVSDIKLIVTNSFDVIVQATIEIDTDAGYKWDWDDLGAGYLVTAVNSGTLTITVPTAPATVVAGARLTILGEERRVVSRSGDDLILDGWFTFNPNGEAIRGSGDLVVPVQSSIKALFRSLGPARSGFAGHSWDDSIRIAKLAAAATDVPGVVDMVLVAPLANVAPDQTILPPGSSVEFLTFGRAEVWKL